MAALIPSASATGSGTMTLAGPSTNSNQTITIPDATGTMMVSGNMPAFSAYANNLQTVTANTFTKMQATVEEFDTASAYDNATNYRFTPQVAGYYQVTGQINPTGTTSVTRSLTSIYKNGSSFKVGIDVNTATAGRTNATALIYLNGSTDYVEFYFLLNGVGTLSLTTSTGADNYFQAVLVRAA
jgi:hypothetical protein